MNAVQIIHVNLSSGAYPIVIGPASHTVLEETVRRVVQQPRIAIITDEHVANLHLKSVTEVLAAHTTMVIRVPPGEESKSKDQAWRIYDDLARARISRSDLIIALGGGVVGDLAGFVAATWMRGVPFIQMPTTLLAAIDASIGGKTGINHPAGKNLVGVFHQPAAVIVDTDYLRTLTEREYVAGLAESIKQAAIRDELFFEWHEKHVEGLRRRDAELTAELIARNCNIKAEVVASDERESGPRMILNHGHTVGHAIEHLLEYDLRHGECVGLGMIVENEIAVRRGLLPRAAADRVASLLDGLGLPTRLPRPCAPERIAEAAHLDKKLRGGKVNFVLLSGIGSPKLVTDVTDDEIASAVRRVMHGNT